MKKIGIITWCNRKVNYGQVLQAFALQKVIGSMGMYSETILYRKKTTKERIAVQKYGRKACNLYEFIYSFCSIPYYLHSANLKFYLFRKKYMNLSENFFTEDELAKSEDEYDCFVCGSDQIWNPIYYDPVYYLSFVQHKKKIAYAPSITTTEYQDYSEQFMLAQKWINRFTAVSTREKVPKEVLSDGNGDEIPVVLDPTLLLTSKQWLRLVPERKIQNDYLLCYFLGDREKSEYQVHRIARKMGIKDIRYISIKENRQSNSQVLCDVGPKDFLSYIKYASYICTDSFHGIAFSILFSKQFKAFCRYENGKPNHDSRITSMLETLQIDERVWSLKSDQMIHIDYSEVNVSLEKERQRSKKFLRDALEGKQDEKHI